VGVVAASADLGLGAGVAQPLVFPPHSSCGCCMRWVEFAVLEPFEVVCVGVCVGGWVDG
jgi:hypothetical protein